LETYNPTGTNHANTIVGYDDNFGHYTEEGETRYGAFKVANSWGTGWGGDHDNDGFYWISYEAMKQRVEYYMFYYDKYDYNPHTIAVFQMTHNKRDECDITVGKGSTSSPTQTKEFAPWNYDGGAHPFPNNKIILDITELNHVDGTFLEVYDGGSSTTGSLDYFAVEFYSDYDSSGGADMIITSSDPPINTVQWSNIYAVCDTALPYGPFHDIAVIDDDESWYGENVENYYTDALDALGLDYDYVDYTTNELNSAWLNAHDTVIWFTGCHWDVNNGAVTSEDEVLLQSFLDNGGNLFLCGQDYLFYEHAPTTFAQNYLHVAAKIDDVGASQVTGVTGNPIGDGLGPYTLNYPFSDFSDEVTKDASAEYAFYNENTKYNAVTYSGSYKTVFFAYPFEALPTASERNLVMARIMSWFGHSGSIKGPYLDYVEIEARTSVDTAIGEVGTGSADMFLYTCSGTTYDALPPAIRGGMYLAPSTVVYTDLFLNPCTGDDGSPVVNSGGTEWFNVTGDKEIRHAFNFLMDRNYIVNDIYNGYASPMYSCVMEWEPSAPEFQSVYNELGLTAAGDETAAIQTINERMDYWETQLGGRLEKVTDAGSPTGYWWYFDGNLLEFNAMIRIEDQRHETGLYIADQIEKCGIKVKRNEWERTKAFSATYFVDPRTPPPDHWNLYTDGWISMSAWKYPETSIAQMYAPWWGWMPGLGEPTWWNYTQNELDTLTKKIVNGQCNGVDDYWNTSRDALKLGIEESVRAFCVSNLGYYPVNNRVSGIPYEKSLGLASRWTFITSETSDKTLKVLQRSSDGSVYWSAFNPVDGITDVYSNYIWRPVRDYGTWCNTEGEPISVRTPFTVEKDFHFEGETLVGEIDVPSDAVIYDPVSATWVTVGTGNKAVSKVTYDLLFSSWHNGAPMDMREVKYHIANIYDLCDNTDSVYNANFAIRNQPILDKIEGIKFVDEDTIEVYGDYQHPASDDLIGDYYAKIVWPYMPWPLWEAMNYLIANSGPISGNLYDYSDTGGEEWLDLLFSGHVEDIRAVLQNYWNDGHIPDSISTEITLTEARSAYQACLAWINGHDHAVISNGPFYLDVYTSPGYMKLTAFRDSYPFSPQDFDNMIPRVNYIVNETVENSFLNLRDDARAIVDGTSNITLAEYTSNPGREYPEYSLEKYIDVYVPDDSLVNEIEVRLY
ncbi:MAG: hypothetical protein ACTSPB_13900, partial [Candidatus Thorarchaeota archaeon]